MLHKETKHLTRKDVAKVYEHIFINEYKLKDKVTNFTPDLLKELIERGES